MKKNIKLRTFLVHVQEVHSHTFEVKAKSRKDAIKKVNDEDESVIDAGDISYSYTLEPDKWTTDDMAEAGGFE